MITGDLSIKGPRPGGIAVAVYNRHAHLDIISHFSGVLKGGSLRARPWVWEQNRCADCEIKIASLKPELMTGDVQAFIRTLESEKPTLQKLYGIDGQTYNLLAQMAIGILGRESLFFTSRMYQVKEEFPWLVDAAKLWKGKHSPNSRGPTQIKKVPDLIANYYGVNPQNLWVSRHAAVATMGFLIESLTELKDLKSRAGDRLNFINEGTYADYLPYIYFGQTRKLMAGQAQPAHNSYIRDMKKYMRWVQLFEQVDVKLTSAK